ncbi:NACHT, LRR and PYD domains-containing protein 12-like isoform X1 [Brachyhypopomus gauderio]|uniref:NACHT, LRR and PYD domains-containing protein 12-like isoform X1 n=1 Tax=Brachyhypopomus gauderio TaxID=698409 RepID=UPI0040422DE6
MSVSGKQHTQKGESMTKRKRSHSPEPSCVSMESDLSMEPPYRFRKRDSSTEFSMIQDKRSDSPESSCVSMKSDRSMDHPRKFRLEVDPTEFSVHKEESVPIYGEHGESIYKELEHKVISLVKKELKRIKKILSPDYPACSGGEMEDEEDHSSVKEGVLKITLHVLRNMNQTDLANKLQTKLVSVYQQELKDKLLNKCKRINEGISQHGSSTLLNEIYTELYITEGGSGDVNNEHEVRQIETASRRPATQETPINCNDLFKDKPIRTVLTKGVAGIGKTVSVQKFILDWAEGRANQDVLFIFPLPFRELNLMKEKWFSLMNLLHHFFPETKQLQLIYCNNYKVIFIFDGLDECRLPLDFENNESVWDETEPTSVDVLLTNLIKGNLLPSALLWITSRPAATNQIPPECVDLVTEVQGFSGPQKEEYFRKRISDQSLANRIISHLKSSRSLYIMCHIPVFCWIAATVLETMLGEAESGEIPKTLTQMFTHFLIFQIKHKNRKYHGKTDTDIDQTRNIVLGLGKLAFQQLEKGNLIFYEEDLRECGIDVKEASVYSGVCTQIFRKETGLHLGCKVFSFVHLSVQEFLAAVYAFLSFISNNNNNVLEQKKRKKNKEGIFSISNVLMCAVDKALQSENGHLDLFLRFLLGLSLESNQTLLQGLLTHTGSSSHSKEETVKYIKEKIRENLSPEKSINLFHCLNELKDDSLEQEVQTYLKRGGTSCIHGASLSPAQWSALVFVLLNSEEELNEFDLSKYEKSEKCLLRLLPVVTASRKAVLSDCSITEEGCAALSSALRSNSSSQLMELNLTNNKPGDSGVKQLSALLEDPHCTLEKLQLKCCSITEEGCAALCSALRSNPSSHLRELYLNHNKPGDSGVKQLSALLEDPHCKLEKLHLYNCSIPEEGCAALCSALRSNPSSHLRELNMKYNKPGGSGVKQLTALLEDSHCKLETLQLFNCSITEEGCAALCSALRSNPSSHLRELNLDYNKPGDSGVKQLSALLEDPHCKLERLDLSNCSITEEGCAALASALRSNPSSQLRELNLNDNNPGGSGVKQLSALLEDPHCTLEKLHLSCCSITEEGCAALCSALRSNPSSHLRELNLNHNKPGDSGVKQLSALLEDPHCTLEKLELERCSIPEEGCAALCSALRSNPSSHLRELNLTNNKPGDTGVKQLSDLLEDPHCPLEKLDI